jgi:hypothetical protein
MRGKLAKKNHDWNPSRDFLIQKPLIDIRVEVFYNSGGKEGSR